MGKHTTISERKLIISHHQKGKSIRTVAEIVEKSVATVQHIIERFKKEGRLISKVRRSPRKIFTETDERWIVRHVKANPRLSATKLATEIEEHLHKKVNPETVRIVLRKHQLHGRVARKKPFISVKNQRARVEFAKEHLNKDVDFWNKVLFTDLINLI